MFIFAAMKRHQSLFRSFQVAFEGLWVLLKEGRNFRIQLAFAVLAVVAGFFFAITAIEWIVILLLIGNVLAAEAVNTCLEELCDLYTTATHPRMKRIKDMAAGMVLLLAIVSVTVGAIIFLPYLLSRT
jgi:diacylglycerol kinase